MRRRKPGLRPKRAFLVAQQLCVANCDTIQTNGENPSRTRPNGEYEEPPLVVKIRRLVPIAGIAGTSAIDRQRNLVARVGSARPRPLSDSGRVR
jgi:hypothetical protein